MRHLSMTLCVVAFACLGALAHGEPPGDQRIPVRDYLTALRSLYEVKCREMADAHVAADFMKVQCECMPGRLLVLGDQLSKEQMDERLSQEEFSDRHMLPVAGFCGRETLQKPYGTACVATFAKSQSNPEKYCACILTGFAAMTDREMGRLGLEAADWIPQAAEAAKRGLPAPEQPPAFKRFSALDASCRT